MVVHGEDEDLVQFNYERFRHEGRMDGANMHLVHTKLSELLAFRRTVALAKAHSAPSTSCTPRPRKASRPSPRRAATAKPIYGETLHQYACFNAEYLQDAARLLLAHVPVAQVPEDQEALWRGLVHDGLATLATDEYRRRSSSSCAGARSRTSPAATWGAEARMGIGYQRGRGQAAA